MRWLSILLLPASAFASCPTVSVDFLYWYANECNLSYAAELEVYSSSLLAPRRVKNLRGSWDPGVRVGLSWTFPCDGWDLTGYWTYYRNEQKEMASTPETMGFIPDVGGKVLQPIWLSSLASAGTFNLYDKIRAKWDFTYNRFDLELGRKTCLSPCFSARPFAGLVGLWTETDFKVKHFSKTGQSGSTIVSNSGTFQTNNNNWSIGMLVGFEPVWYFTRCFSLFGKFAVALSWGDFRDNQKEKASFSQLPGDSAFISYRTKDSFSCMQPIIDMTLGFRYDWGCFSLDAGWENHILFDHNQRVSAAGAVSTFTSNGQTIVVPPISWGSFDVGIGGLTLRAACKF